MVKAERRVHGGAWGGGRVWRLAFAAVLIVGTGHHAGAQPLAINPSAAASDVRNPSSTNPAAAASDIRNPSAINPSAAASQILQPSGLVPRRSRNGMPTILMPPIVEERIVRPPRRSRAVQRTRRGRPAIRQAERRRERPASSRRRATPADGHHGKRLPGLLNPRRAATLASLFLRACSSFWSRDPTQGGFGRLSFCSRGSRNRDGSGYRSSCPDARTGTTRFMVG